MARQGIGFFDSRGQFFKTPENATLSDLSMLFGKLGEHDGLAPGLAHLMLDRREDIERIFAEHDIMRAAADAQDHPKIASLDEERLIRGK